jgi:hypothetical protein
MYYEKTNEGVNKLISQGGLNEGSQKWSRIYYCKGNKSK